MSNWQKFTKKLKCHPGVPVATALMFMGFVAGANGERWYIKGAIGAAIMCVFWIPVIATAWQRRNDT